MNILKKIYNTISALQSISSSNQKKELLLNIYNESDKDDYKIFIQYFDYVYNEIKYTYNLKSYKQSTSNLPSQDLDNSQWNLLSNLLEALNIGTGGQDEKKLIEENLLKFTEETTILFDYVLDRSINAGIERKIISDIFPELNHLISPYMRCEKEDMLYKRIKFPAISQTKADGLFMNIFLNDLKFISRYGNRLFLNESAPLFKTLNLLKNGLNEKRLVLHGELLVKINNKILPRKEGNGRINSLLKKHQTLKNLDKKILSAKSDKARQKLETEKKERLEEYQLTENSLILSVWDIIPEKDFYNRKCDIPYDKRFELVSKLVKSLNNENIQLIPFKIVNSFEEVFAHFDENRKNGEEGTVVKNLNIIWKHDVNRDGIIKLKDFNDCDLICVGYNAGDGIYTGGIGSLICESSDGLVKVDISSGLTFEERGLERVDINDSSKGLKPIENFNFDQYTGKIIAVKYNEKITSKDKDGYSLFIPKIEEIREDKKEADHSKDIK